MKVEVNVPEIASLFKKIKEQPKHFFEMIRVEIRQNVGEYLSKETEYRDHFCGFSCF